VVISPPTTNASRWALVRVNLLIGSRLNEIEMKIFETPSTRKILVFLILWAFLSSLVMFLVNFWASDFVAIAGCALSYSTLALCEKFKTQSSFTRVVFTITSFVLITFFSFGLLWLLCSVNIIPNTFCGEHGRASLLFSNIFYVGMPIAVIYLFVLIPGNDFLKKP
jgi:hypothetical protein